MIDPHALGRTGVFEDSGIIARPKSRRTLLRTNDPARANDEQQEEHVEEVLPTQPRRQTNRSTLRQWSRSAISRDEDSNFRKCAQPLGNQDDDGERNEGHGTPAGYLFPLHIHTHKSSR